jgi:N-dimethylarginine dimethylaminohydrolase
MNDSKATRRSFLQASAGAAAAFALSGNASAVPAKEEPAVPNHKPLTKVNCFSEDGELKEVIFGRYEDARIPDYDPIFDFGGPTATQLMKEHGGKLFSDAKPELFKKVRDMAERMVDFLEGRGIVVHRPREHTKDENANFALQSRMNLNGYNRDSLVAIGNTLVENSLKTPERIRNKYAVRYVSMELMRNGNRVLSMPQPLDTYEPNENESPLAEGGDIEIDDGNIYIGNSGQATNSLGVLWYKNAFPDWNVHEIMISSEKFPHQHLDCAMVIGRNFGCVLIEDIVGGYNGLPKPLQKKKWIELTRDEAESKLANFIFINPEEVLMATEAERLRKEVEKTGVKVHHFPYYDVGKTFGGSLRCNTCPIYRVG